jgi:hypothetical protein
VALILFDRAVAVAVAVRRVLTARGDGSMATRLALIASLGVLAATAISAVVTLRTPEELPPLALDPPPAVGTVDTPAVEVPGTGARPADTTPPTSAHSAFTAAPPVSGPPADAPPATATASPVRVALRADFAVEDTALLSYGAAVTISNPGPPAVPDWKLVITLPRERLEITSVRGARASRDGAVWTFVPDGSAGQVPGGGSVRVTFRVSGAQTSSMPTACTIDGAACTGLPA